MKRTFIVVVGIIVGMIVMLVVAVGKTPVNLQ
jgi:hypothetical protein